ncbi:MAG: acyl carrier protein [Candidatus Omnitrophica bacterium]|nr:acyl carrier protein [Candidatus Omnitrophota bacterium]
MSLFEEIREIICEQLDAEPEEITPETSFINDLWLDSFDAIELITALERKYGIEISNEDSEKMGTVDDMVRYIELKTRR